jgi:hypothetical protein
MRCELTCSIDAATVTGFSTRASVYYLKVLALMAPGQFLSWSARQDQEGPVEW